MNERRSSALATSRRGDRPQKYASLLARQIVGDILQRQLEPGAMLPPERDMLLQYDVGRGTLREALRYLELQGVLRMRPGPGGGPMVSQPDATHLGATLALLLAISRVTYRDVLDTRLMVEPEMAALAALNITPEQLDELAKCAESMERARDDDRVFLYENLHFHHILAEACGNRVLGFIVGSLSQIVGDQYGARYGTRERREMVRAHNRLLEAIREHDAEEARQAMWDHISSGVNYIEKKFPNLLDRPLTADDIDS